MYLFLILTSAPIFSFCFLIVHAVAITSRSSLFLNSVGPDTNLTISNGMIAPDGFLRSATLAGGTFPGPLIKATKGENFSINVINELTDTEMWLSTSVHWHGIFQNGSNFMDGAAFVTQCPISPNNSFLYQFSAMNQTGTYMYHSHYFSQRCDGLRGPLVIYDPDDPYRNLYDVDDETTVISLSDWYHTASPVLDYLVGVTATSTLINGLGRYPGGPQSELAIVNVQYGKRYRLRLVGISCDPNFILSIDGHNLTIIEADGILTAPLLVDSLQVLAGQRYSVILNATKPVGNYWIRALPSTTNSTFDGGLNSAILRYSGAPIQDPKTNQATSVMPLLEQNLHTLIDPGAPGIHEYGKADINIEISANNSGGVFYMNGVRYRPPTTPVLLQIMSGAQEATDLMPSGSVIVLGPNKVVELTMKIIGLGGPHPVHLHGHAFDVVQSAGANATFNYNNPVRRDVVSAGTQGQQMVIRWVTDNTGPWFLHCHIDWHVEAGFAVVMVENPGGVSNRLGSIPTSWDDLCPTYNSLPSSQLGAVDAEQEAAKDRLWEKWTISLVWVRLRVSFFLTQNVYSTYALFLVYGTAYASFSDWFTLWGFHFAPQNTMGLGLPAHISPGIVNIPGRDPQAQAVAESLLEQDREVHHCFFNKQSFHNHLSHHLLAAYDLSAPAALLQAIYNAECGIQKPIDDPPEPEHVKVTPGNFTKFVGQAKYYHAFLVFFTEQIKEHGMSETVENYVFSPAVNVKGIYMLARFMGGLYHPFIQTGYGVEFGSDAMVAQGLAQAAVHAPLVADLLDSTMEISASKTTIGDGSKSGRHLLHLLRELYDSDALKPVPYDPDKSIVQYRADTLKGGRPEAIRQLCATWWGSETLEDQAFQSTIDLKVEELFWANALFLCGTGKRGQKPRLDFALMHALNATLFLPSLLKAISSTSKVKLLKAFLPVTIMFVLARGRPRIDARLVMSHTTAAPRPPEQPSNMALKPSVGAVGDPNGTYNPWLNICASVVHAPDAHTVKAIRALYYAAQLYGHKQPRDVPGCFIDGDHQKETLLGSSELDGTLFVRAAGVVMETLGWVTHGDDPGKWDFSGLGWDDAWQD